MSGNIDDWAEKRCEGLEALQEHITTMVRPYRTPEKRLAWRGVAKTDWKLCSTLDRCLDPDSRAEDYCLDPDSRAEDYSTCVEFERHILEQFRQRALPFANSLELEYLQGGLKGEGVWKIMALGRHSGLPTRILDWTRSPWVAAYFACIEHEDTDGAIWWFTQSDLEGIVDSHWDGWHVPTRAEVDNLNDIDDTHIRALGLDQRALEETAFHADGYPWITKLHYSLPVPRMEAQQSFMTTCGRILENHNDAIDRLAQIGTIERGRIIIPAAIKSDVLEWLALLNVNAQSLKYPGIDIAAGKIATLACDPKSSIFDWLRGRQPDTE